MGKLLDQLVTVFRAAPKEKREEEPSATTAPFVAFEPHNDIERLLVEAATKADTRQAFRRALLEAKLYAATPETPEAPETWIATEGEHLALLNVQGPDGAPVAAIFTAQERIIEVFGMGTGFVAVQGRDLLEMVAGLGAWLNPGFPYSVYWKSDELAAYLDKSVPRALTKNTPVMLGAPADPPAALVGTLKAVLGGDKRIAEAWFALAHWPDDGASSWYLDVRTDLTPAAVRDLLADTFAQADYAGRPLDMIVNKPGGRAGAGIRIAPQQTH